MAKTTLMKPETRSPGDPWPILLAAKRLGLNVKTLRGLIESGQVAAFRIGVKIFISDDTMTRLCREGLGLVTMPSPTHTDFPIPEADCQTRRGGMTLRDYFAASVLTGLASRPNAELGGVVFVEFAATRSYEIADAMLAQREKKET